MGKTNKRYPTVPDLYILEKPDIIVFKSSQLPKETEKSILQKGGDWNSDTTGAIIKVYCSFSDSTVIT